MTVTVHGGVNYILSVLRNPNIALTIAFTRGKDFAIGWNEGVGRYRASCGGVVPGSSWDPREWPQRFAASEAAVAYCIGMERGR